MTEPENNPETDEPEPTADASTEERSTVQVVLDELHRWRFFIIGLLLLAGVGAYVYGVSVPWQLIAVSIAGLLVSIAIGFTVGFPVAVKRARPPEQTGLLVLDPRPRDIRVGIEWFDRDEAKELTVTWGSLIETPTRDPGTKLLIALTYDEETHSARGIYRSTKEPDELLRTEYDLEDYYGQMEIDAAGKQTLEHQFRSAVRRATMALTAHQDRVYDEATIPNGETLTEVLDDLMPKPDDADDDGDVTEHEPDEETEDVEHSYQPDPEAGEPVGALGPAVTDGGTE
ncbi:hypothetical protein C482_03699 [Natrialba chahannaoensis JCM 10990]|uniref:DUF8125 domain-containing protein n=1 Tax=Natrialba chahannaoensis JCM 10990 TaxID=1227492 RepID=M0AYZ1_9EURY|nr:hypothetical protein [Natrialba chahannaoensis]ELZ03507.1 hypothetical protein C482_03699 [Natrialba chahannaoensis JCM 10990]